MQKPKPPTCKLFTAGMPAATSANKAFLQLREEATGGGGAAGDECLLSVAGVGPLGWLRMIRKSGFTA